MTVDPTDRSKMFYWQADRPFDEKQVKEIFTDRHDNFDQNLAVQAIEQGMKQPVIKVEGMMKFGTVNVSIKVKIKDGRWVIFRAHPPQIKNGYFWAEAAAAKAAIAADVPSYETYLIDDSRKKFDFDYTLIECLPGKTMEALWPLAQALDKKLINQAGEFLAKIHSIKLKNFGFFDNRFAKQGELVGIHKNWFSHIRGGLDNNLEYLWQTKVISDGQATGIRKIFRESEFFLKQGVLIQNDLADWNMLVDNDKISGIIDWDESHSGDPVMDFACFSLFFPDQRLQYLIDGYKTVSQLPENFAEKMHLYKLRYVVAKLVIRKKKLMFYQDKHFRDLLARGLQVLTEELKYYRI